MLKKGLSLLLICCISLSLFAGCEKAPQTVKPITEYTLEEIYALPDYTYTDIANTPELEEVHLSVALDTDVVYSFPLIEKISKYGLSSPFEDDAFGKNQSMFYSAKYLLSYISVIYAISSPDAVSFINQDSDIAEETRFIWYDVHLDADHLSAAADIAMASTNFSENAETIFTYELENESYITSFPQHTEYDDSTRKIIWEDIGDQRIVTVFSLDSNVFLIDCSQYIYKKKNNQYSLVGGYHEYVFKEETIPFGHSLYVLPFEETSTNTATAIDVAMLPHHTDNNVILGNINKTILMASVWDKTVTLTKLNWNTFEPEQTATYEGTLHNYRLLEDELFLLFDDRVIVINENLEIVREAAVPDVITDLMQRNYGETYAFATLTHYNYDDIISFGGYDVSQDLQVFAYSYEQGLFLFNTKTQTETMLYESSIGSFPGNDRVIFTFWGPKFSYDDNTVYGSFSTYEFASSFSGFDCATGEEINIFEHVTIRDDQPLALTSPQFYGFHYYFLYAFYVEPPAPFLGQGYYVHQFENHTYPPTQDDPWIALCPLGEMPSDNGVKLVPTLLDVYSFSDTGPFPGHTISAVLSDGRIIFESQDGYFYCSPTYEELQALIQS